MEDVPPDLLLVFLGWPQLPSLMKYIVLFLKKKKKKKIYTSQRQPLSLSLST